MAEGLAVSWQPASGLVAHLLCSDAEGEALNEAYQFVRTWDTMAQEQTMAWMAMRIIERVHTQTPLILRSIARVGIGENGRACFILPGGAASRREIQPEAACMMLLGWDGLDGAADLAAEQLADPDDRTTLGNALLVRWNREVGGYDRQVRGLPVAA